MQSCRGDEESDRDHLIRKLTAGGYVRTAIVEEPGDFSVRGSIVDVFSPLYSEPLRVEMFGDMVESLRFFSASSQRSLENVSEAVILPARETILWPEETDVFLNRVRKHASLLDIPLKSVKKAVEQIKNEGLFPGMESLLPLLYPEPATFFDYLPESSLIVLSEPDSLEKTMTEEDTETQENWLRARSEGQFCLLPEQIWLGQSETRKLLWKNKPLILRDLKISSGAPSEPDSHPVFDFSVENNLRMRDQLKEHRDEDFPLKPLSDWILQKQAADYAVLPVCGTRSAAERLASLLSPYGISCKFADGFPEIPEKGNVCICLGSLSSGFVWASEALALITESEIFGPNRSRKKKSGRRVRTELLTFENLNVGDLVVHSEHGIGRYEGLSKLKLNGSEGDFLRILYKDDDRLYLPVDRMGMVQKYMGVDGITPILDKMGGASWGRVREKVKKSVEKIAGDLLKIYAERSVNQGTAFDISHYDFQGFEAGFPYEETPDQRKAIEDVLSDMARAEPMDRLICGDVGYGKTEVALRASFVAVNNFRQVAVLVPTTVLAEQHFETFSSRYEEFPVKIACLSRFRSPKEQREILEGLRNGKIDIVIGTHRLLQKDIAFKSLGLIILDEEQRFGVRHKEKLKAMKATVDVLTLTATPIPRTLHLSLMGIRDISLISTPPEDRHAIITSVSEYDDSIAAEAIRRELERRGQMFFVHNHVESIGKTTDHLRQLVPEVRADIAHGQMNEDELERVMLRFTNRETDMLVCTSIIESGLDVPSANTILINRADCFGLSQIYQLRGRVGRAGEQAYAYLFIPRESTLSKDARKRLKVLMEHNDLGAGFQIAMSDLQIRGGGTILGASQSGHIAAVGYDMFLKLMEEAVANLKGETVTGALEPEINIPFSAYIPEEYMPDTDQRLTAYRRLSKMDSLKEISDFKTEMEDRFGPLPEHGMNLLLKIMLRVLAVKAGVKRLDLFTRIIPQPAPVPAKKGWKSAPAKPAPEPAPVAETLLSLHFSQNHQKNPYGLADMIVSQKQGLEFTPDHVLKARLSGTGAGPLLSQAKNILKEITRHVNA
ncbi:MAG: transcription-repair coupling factor [Desulfobacterales bacterium]